MKKFGGVTMLGGIRHNFTALLLILVGFGYGWAATHSTQADTGKSLEPSTPKAAKAFEIGAYRIDMAIPRDKHLVELTPDEYSFFPRAFENEKSYNAPPTGFLGWQWNVMLGTVNGRVYKVAAFVDDLTPAEGARLLTLAKKHCLTVLGKPAEQTPDQAVWDMEGGNVILRSATIMGSVSINLFATSTTIRPGDRLRK